MSNSHFWLSEEQFSRLEPLLPNDTVVSRIFRKFVFGRQLRVPASSGDLELR